MPLARKQISLIHLAKSRLGVTDGKYRAILRQAGGIESSRELDGPDFQRVMDRFAQLGFRSDYRARTWGQRAGMASHAQIKLIRALWREYTDGEGDDASLGKWLERTFKVSALRFLPRALAPKAIAALKNMKARKAYP